jgi:Tfp pilus assembly protein PilO
VNPHEPQRRAIRYLAFAVAAGTAWWGVSRGAPLYGELRSVRAHAATVQATTRAAREQTVRSGGAGIEDSIAAARTRFEAIAELVPTTGAGAGDSELRRLIAALAERNGVVIRSSEDAPAERDGSLLVSTVRITAEGQYHDVGRWLAAVGATRRLVRLGSATLGAAADTSGGVGEGSLPGPAERSGSVRFEGSFHWYHRDPAAPGQDSITEAR